MEEQRELRITGGESRNVPGRPVLMASLAGVAVGGPLLGMMGFSFVATLTLLLVTSPLLLIFSPLLFIAGFVFVAALTGFSAAAVMSFAGMSAFEWVFRSFLGGPQGYRFDIGWAEAVKEQGRDWAKYLQQKVQNPEEEIEVRRG